MMTNIPLWSKWPQSVVWRLTKVPREEHTMCTKGSLCLWMGYWHNMHQTQRFRLWKKHMKVNLRFIFNRPISTESHRWKKRSLPDLNTARTASWAANNNYLQINDKIVWIWWNVPAETLVVGRACHSGPCYLFKCLKTLISNYSFKTATFSLNHGKMCSIVRN